MSFFMSNGFKTNKLKGKRLKKERTSERGKYLFENVFVRFLEVREAEGRSKGTIKKDRLNFSFFREFIEKKDIGNDVRLITSEVIREYIRWMLNEKVRFEGHKYKTEEEKTVGLSPTTVNTRLQTLKVFFRYLHQEGLIEQNPMAGIKNVRESESEIRVITVDELKRLFAVPNQRKYAEFRDYVLMNLLLDTFMRINEALTLRKTDINFENNSITIRGEVSKNHKARILPMQNSTARLLKELLKEIEEFYSDYVFLTNYGEPLTDNQFRKRLRIYSERAGLDYVVHPHLFRHTGATMFLENGGDLRHLQILLGHSDLRTVIRYTHLSNKSIQAQHSKYSPMGNVLGKLNRDRKILRDD